ncbi:MAG: hypothetical protein ACE5O2_05995 [Armatimonadota bacterium]
MALKLRRWLRVYADGNHNAFTDICWFRGAPYCTFRHATNHVSEDGRVLVLRGNQTGERWQVVASIRANSDTRDPKLMVTPKGLFSYSFVRFQDERPDRYNRATGYSFSRDGSTWTRWRLVEEDLIYWRPRWHEGRGYVAAYRCEDWSVVFKTTEDGRNWENASVLARRTGEPRPNEVAFDFAPDGTCWALVRREYEQGHPLLAKARPPYTKWRCKELNLKLQGPCLWFVGEQAYISGRWYQPGGYVNTAIFRLVDDAPVCEVVLPSGGDTSYMGVAQHPDDEKRYWLTYYSSHEFNPKPNSHEHAANIYLCDVVFDD